MSYKSDFTKTGKEMFIDLLNWANRNTMATLLRSDDVVLSDPVSLPRESNMNTAIRLVHVAGFMLTEETRQIEYNRLDIDQLAKVLNFSYRLELSQGKEYKTTLDILDDLFKIFKVKLTTDDVEEKPLDIDFTKEEADANEGIRVHLAMKPTSVAYTGDLYISVFPKPVDIRTNIRTTVLGGFMFPRTYGLG
nr:MAG TPA: Putative virion structural protein [Caudoviricetes sp.]